MDDQEYIEIDGVLVNRELAEDPNYKAYKDIEDLLRQSYVGQWVCFAHGEMIAVEPTEDEIFAKVQKLAPEEEAFIKKIEAVERIYNLRSPRVVS